MIIVKKAMDNGIEVSKAVRYNKESVEDSKKTFERLKEKKVILNEKFEDDKWRIYDGLQISGVDFTFNEMVYMQESKSREILTISELTNSVKSFAIISMSSKSRSGVERCVRILRNFLNTTHFLNKNFADTRFKALEISEDYQCDKLSGLVYVKKFLEYVELPDSDYYLELLEKDREAMNTFILSKNTDDGRRTLADFQSMFLFDELLTEFWPQATELEKLAYFPIYLWWRLTNILPLRVTEFLATPFNCISPDNKKITIRRTNLKGIDSEDFVSHNIDEDYSLHTYPISDSIVHEIQEYKKLLKKYCNIDNKKFLIFSGVWIRKGNFVPRRLGENYEYPHGVETIFAGNAFRERIKYFFVTIIQKRMGVEIVEFEDEGRYKTILKPNQIQHIKPGDTRHFATINMILNDFNPVLVKDFAGHSDIDITYHYFGNIGNLVKCISYYKYQALREYTEDEVLTTSGDISIDKVLVNLEKDASQGVEIDEGFCLSDNFASGDISDCIPVCGDCNACDFAKKTKRDTKEKRQARLRQYEENMNREGKLLGSLLVNYKNTLREDRLINKAITKLQNQSAMYLKEVELNGGYYDE